ncbi:LacI family DNA-binding transcriptional regulator [Carnobacterium funditum]|uniref:LacI family DNA-binding transcriptional regulator n=1 Tax=Carnobacterium funditum TaxID=2752 RepID=UPI00054ECA9A|nr:LacI family DNA-binding transcriptional regulator [Carnobacterium funditum]
MVTIRDVALKAQTSIATVSRVINNKPGFSEETKQKVQQAMKELDYETNEIARSLITNKTNTIGVIVPNIASMLTHDLLNGIENLSQSRKYSIIVCYTYSNQERTMEYLKTLKEKRVDGIIFTSENLTDENIKYIKKINIPIVLLSTFSEKYKLPFVKVDDYQASYAAVEYLIGKGHKNIGMLSGDPNDKISGEPRIRGYKEALKDHHLFYNEERIIVGNNFSFEDGRSNVVTLLENFPEMTAIFSASDEMAAGAIATAHEKKINIPEELSIIGYDNILVSQMVYPPLTTIEQPLYDMGYTAAEMLFHQIDEKELINKEVYLPFKIIERKSVKVIDSL